MDPEGKNFGRGIDVQTLVFYCFLLFFHLTLFLVIFTVNICFSTSTSKQTSLYMFILLSLSCKVL